MINGRLTRGFFAGTGGCPAPASGCPAPSLWWPYRAARTPWLAGHSFDAVDPLVWSGTVTQ